jgi:DNA sulfur modification protein DndB
MKQAALVMPALRGAFGDWIYYACLMPIRELGARVRYAEEVHPDKALSRLIQRSLEGARAKYIAEYLASTPERFFNSLVLATYGGSPEWLEVGNFRSTTKSKLLKQISEEAMDTLGFLSLNGSEKIFALDGQHRLAGIKRAMSEGVDLGKEQVAVLLVGHQRDAAGLQRTRRLFTTLNKTAVPVRKRDIIALDEDDVMAIVARRMVETNAAFRDPKIAVISSQNIPAGNRVCLTTIASLYDTLKIIFLFDIGQRSDRILRFNRPKDERLDRYYELAIGYFSSLGKIFEPVERLLSAGDVGKITEEQRGPHGGHLLFRPVGLEIVTRTAVDIAKEFDIPLSKAVDRLKGLPTDIAKPPFQGVLWDPIRHTIIVRGKAVANNLVRYMAGLNVDEDDLVATYRTTLGFEPHDPTLKLPEKIA